MLIEEWAIVINGHSPGIQPSPKFTNLRNFQPIAERTATPRVARRLRIASTVSVPSALRDFDESGNLLSHARQHQTEYCSHFSIRDREP